MTSVISMNALHARMDSPPGGSGKVHQQAGSQMQGIFTATAVY